MEPSKWFMMVHTRDLYFRLKFRDLAKQYSQNTTPFKNIFENLFFKNYFLSLLIWIKEHEAEESIQQIASMNSLPTMPSVYVFDAIESKFSHRISPTESKESPQLSGGFPTRRLKRSSSGYFNNNNNILTTSGFATNRV